MEGVDMKVLLTGHDGFIGAVMAPWLTSRGHEVVGLDSLLFGGCDFGPASVTVPAHHIDVRDVEESHLAGFDAVIHLAGLSNDVLGDLDPELTYDINYRASLRIAQLAKDAGVSRFLFASSCSMYGTSGDALLTEKAEFNPLTPYAISKVKVEEGLSAMAADGFSPTFLRNATVYGVSPKLRFDLVVNNLTGYAVTTGEVRIQSDGSPWRPLVHVEDVCRAFLAVLEAPRELVHNQAFNVGRNEDNLQVRDIARVVEEVVPGSRITYAGDAPADNRCYRVDCSRLPKVLPGFEPQWTLRAGIESLHRAYLDSGLNLDHLTQQFVRIKHLTDLMGDNAIDSSLRWRSSPDALTERSGPERVRA
jgi:nucleoside-diphosphate-sugar epimerase